LKGYRRELGCHQPCDAERALEAALAYREDIAQAAFERWLVEKLLTVTAAQVAHAEAVESFIKPEIKGHNVEPPPEAQTEAEKIAYCAGWWAAMEAKRGQNPQEQAEPDRVPVKRSGMQALSKALGHPTQISAKDGDTVDDALIELAVSRLEQAEQAEPVAWMVYTQDGKSVCVTDNPADFTGEHRALPLYTSPPRQWQTLSDEEIYPLYNEPRSDAEMVEFARAVEEKLRAKNSTLACIPAVPPV
jgi:hypothetical protein